jgi:hypothetical protein
MFADLFKFINKTYKHDFISHGPLNSENVRDNEIVAYICTNCNKLYVTNNIHDNEDWPAGIDFNNKNYEMYNSPDEDDFEYIEIEDLITCEEQIIKNLLE